MHKIYSKLGIAIALVVIVAALAAGVPMYLDHECRTNWVGVEAKWVFGCMIKSGETFIQVPSIPTPAPEKLLSKPSSHPPPANWWQSM
jgi:hypothetical protein